MVITFEKKAAVEDLKDFTDKVKEINKNIPVKIVQVPVSDYLVEIDVDNSDVPLTTKEKNDLRQILISKLFVEKP